MVLVFMPNLYEGNIELLWIKTGMNLGKMNQNTKSYNFQNTFEEVLYGWAKQMIFELKHNQ